MKPMRTLPTLLAVPLLASATPPAAIVSLPSYEEPARPWPNVQETEATKDCRKRIELARAAAGRPRLDRAPADANKPILHYAVDRRIDGCGVLVPVGDPAGMLPPPEPGPPVVLPAKPGG
jgi:hypothetical protein